MFLHTIDRMFTSVEKASTELSKDQLPDWNR